jgi:ATPase subunit of ABC transporter with duplicated ATPase domains
MQIISADERLRERRGAKILVIGPTGVGKTSLLRGLDAERTLFVDVEAGDLAVLDLAVPTIRLDDPPLQSQTMMQKSSNPPPLR